MKKIYSIFIGLISVASFGQVLAEDFNYADSALLTANGWTAHSGSGTQAIDVGPSNGLTYTGYSGLAGFTATAVGNAAKLDNNGEDVNKAFAAPVTTGELYVSFLINVTTAVDGYFFSLGTGTSTFYSRLYARPSATSGKINFGVGNSAASYSTTDFDPGITYLAVIKYGVSTTGPVSLWIIPSGIPATEAAAGTPTATATGSGGASVAGAYLRQYNASQNITIDGLRIYSTWFNTTACALSLGTETATCDAITLGIDTYNVSIPYTGGGSGSYTLTTNAGTIGGDNPNSVAAGNITITGITEGTIVNFGITGSCTLSKTIASPNCKPINTLPLNEPFNYAPATTLNSTQMWTVANTGDDIVTEAGNLTYAGITPTGNRATFAGAGAESRTPFTSTNSGVVYARFLNSVTDLTGITAGGITYSALFTDDTGAFTNARLWIRENAGQYQYGLSATSSGAAAIWSPNLHTVGTTQYLLFSYDITNNILALFENPTLPSTANVSVSLNLALPKPANIGGFMLRQETAALTPVTIVDELLIDTAIPDGLTLSRNDFDAIAGLRVYPNPANTVLNITSDSFATKNVEIYNVMGAKVLATQVTNTPVNVASLTTGIYMVKVTEEGKTATRKLVIE